MASKYPKGSTIYVPASALPEPSSYNHALVRHDVVRNTRRSVVVTTSDGTSVTVGSSRVHPSDLGLLVLRVGDLQSESGVLDPLSRSVVEFFRLLIPDDYVELLELRTLVELEQFWDRRHGAFTHIVIIGHGTSAFVPFVGMPSGVNGEMLSAALDVAGIKPKQIVSLACATGRAEFAKSFSAGVACAQFVAPYKPVHAAAASHFCQTYFTEVLLEGRTPKTAFNRAASAVIGLSHFRLWKNGRIVAGKALR